MARVDAATLDWDNPVKPEGDWVLYLVPHWEVILEAFAPYQGDVLVERAIRACQDALDERPEPGTAAEANVRFRQVRDYARGEQQKARQRAKEQAKLRRMG